MKIKKIKQLLKDIREFNQLPDAEVPVGEGPLRIGAQLIRIVKPNNHPSFKAICKFIESIDANEVVEETARINASIGAPIFVVMGNPDSPVKVVLLNTRFGYIGMNVVPDEVIQEEMTHHAEVPELEDEQVIEILKNVKID